MGIREEDLPMWARAQIAEKLAKEKLRKVKATLPEPEEREAERSLRDGPDERLPVSIAIPLDPRTKKNSPRIVGTGKKCAVCGKLERQWVAQSSANAAYVKAAKEFLHWEGPPLSGKVNIKCLFYMKTRRRVDQTNLISTVDDFLVERGVLEDDNSNIVKGHDGSRVYHDPKNPRTEITITQFTEEDEA